MTTAPFIGWPNRPTSPIDVAAMWATDIMPTRPRQVGQREGSDLDLVGRDIERQMATRAIADDGYPCGGLGRSPIGSIASEETLSGRAWVCATSADGIGVDGTQILKPLESFDIFIGRLLRSFSFF